MTFHHPNLAFSESFLSFAVVILGWQALKGVPVFRGEFILEDCILLLIVSFNVIPNWLKPLFRHLILCLATGALGLLVANILSFSSFLATAYVGACAVFALQYAKLAIQDLAEFRQSKTGVV